MINKLYLKHFKAFKEPAELVVDGKNVLIYGENGAGKSSLYQALKVVFHRKRIFDKEIKETTDALSRPSAEADVLRRYNYQKESNTDFELKINDTDYKTYTPTNCDVSMISREDVLAKSEIDVVSFLRCSVVGIADAAAFVKDKKVLIETTVNDLLNKYFCEENITVELTYRDPQWLLTIKDSSRDTRGRNEKLTEYFNEAKLHIVKLLLLLTAVLNNGAKERGEERVLVLDDVISSLDAENRTFFVRLLNDKFGDYQKIILTHSISFFNLASYSFTIIYGQREDWKLYHVEERDGNSVIEARDAQDYASNIRKDNKNRRRYPVEVIGNRIRKRFEFLVGEVSRLLCVGGLVESSTLIEAINTPKKMYFVYDTASKQIKTIYDMVEELAAIIEADTVSALKTQLQEVTSRYEANSDVTKLRKTIQDLAIYQKVSMHPLSHSCGTLPVFTDDEVKRSITLLMMLEKQLGTLIGRDYYSI